MDSMLFYYDIDFIPWYKAIEVKVDVTCHIRVDYYL